MIYKLYRVWFLVFIPFFVEAQEPKLVLPTGHASELSSAIFSPDGKKVLTASDDQTARIWDAATGNMLLELKGHQDAVNSAVFSPDGRMILTASDDKTARIWEAATGKVLRAFGGHTDGINSAVFSLDGKRFLTASEDHTARIWEIATGKMVQEFKRLPGYENSAAFSPDGKWIITTTKDHNAAIWEVATGKRLILKEDSTTIVPVTSAIFTPDGKRILTTSKGYAPMIWEASTGKMLKKLEWSPGWTLPGSVSLDGKRYVTTNDDFATMIHETSTGKMLQKLAGHTSGINAIVFSRDGNKMLSCSKDHTAILWEVATGKIMQQFRGHSGAVASAVFSPDEKSVLTASEDYTARIWDVASGTALQNLKGHTSVVYSGAFSPDGEKIATAYEDFTARVWEVATGKTLQQFKGHTGIVVSVVFSPDGNRILTASQDSTLRIWDIASGKVVQEIKEPSGQFLSAAFSPDGKWILAISNKVKLWEAATGKVLQQFDVHRDGAVESAAFSQDGKLVLTGSENRTCNIWQASSGKMLQEFDVASMVVSAVFSPDGKQILASTRNNKVQILDVALGKSLQELGENLGRVSSVVYSHDGKRILTASYDGTARIWEAASGKMLQLIKAHRALITSAGFSPDEKKILTTSGDMTAKLWDVETGNPIYTFIAVDSIDYFIQVPFGFYRATQNAARLLHYVNKDLSIINFEQLDIRYNRPDKVLKAINYPDTGLISAYQKAYEKRIRKLEIDTTVFKDGYTMPEADFTNRNEIAYQTSNDRLTVGINAKDSNYLLSRFNLWVNGVPQFGVRGIHINGKKTKFFDTTINLTLSQGNNRLETSVINANGIESYRSPILVNYSPLKPQKEKVYFIGIGAQEFADSKHDLAWSVKDVRDLARRLKDRYGPDCEIDTLFNESVTKEKVNALKQALLKTGVNDKVILAYSGHGLLSKDYDYYLSTYNVNFQNPEQNGLPYEALENLLDSIPARRKLMLIDACHSGELDKEEMKKVIAVQSELKKENNVSPGKRGTIVTNSKTRKIGMKNSFELMQELFVNVGRGTGSTIISAASGIQFAFERGDLKNGVFTYSVMELLKPGQMVMVNALKEHVIKRVNELTHGLQQPATRNETIGVDWQVW